MDHSLDINSLELPPAFEAVPLPDRFPDGLRALDSIVADLAADRLLFVQLVITADGGE
jgi:hypothetical protein